jgi:hypothetical protein
MEVNYQLHSTTIASAPEGKLPELIEQAHVWAQELVLTPSVAK